MRQPKLGLSLQPPWWWAVLHLGKDIENRPWSTRFRGRIWLHASRAYVHRSVIDDLWYIQRIVPGCQTKILEAGHPHRFLRAHGGTIVGSVEIVDCVTESASPWFSGKYGFVLANPIALAEPVVCRGALGLFEVDPQVLKQLRRK